MRVKLNGNGENVIFLAVVVKFRFFQACVMFLFAIKSKLVIFDKFMCYKMSFKLLFLEKYLFYFFKSIKNIYLFDSR